PAALAEAGWTPAVHITRYRYRGHPARRRGTAGYRHRARRFGGRRSCAGADRRPQVFLRVLVCRDRRDARRFGAHRAATVGEGARLPAPRCPRGGFAAATADDRAGGMTEMEAITRTRW